MADFADLTYAEFRVALETVPVGRVAVCTRDGAEIVPVNYTLLDESVVFRTTPFQHAGSDAAVCRRFATVRIAAARERGPFRRSARPACGS